MSKKPQTGVSRRKFLGAMAAAPVVAPAMAKEALAPTSQFVTPNYIRGLARRSMIGHAGDLQTLTVKLDTSALEAMTARFEEQIRTLPDRANVKMTADGLFNSSGDLITEYGTITDATVMAVKPTAFDSFPPNNLLGAYLMEDGCAT